MPEGFCTHCGLQIESFEGLSECPRCGATGVPCSYEHQVDININKHELRLLCIWAENYGQSIGQPDVVYAIAARLRKQIGENAALTMADEFLHLREAGLDYETNHPSDPP